MKRLLVILFLASIGSADAATIVAGSASYDDVNAAVAAAMRGDTVVVPAGSANWGTHTLTLTKGIFLRGPGRDSLTITTAVSNPVYTSPYAVIIVSPDATAIANDEVIRIEGFTFDGNNVAKNIINTNGTNSVATKPFRNFVLGNCRFKNMSTSAASAATIYNRGQIRGVIFGNIFDRCAQIFEVMGNNSLSEWSNGNFPFAFGNSDNLFFENNTIQFSSAYSSYIAGWTESGQGARIVVRYNNWNFANMTAGHELWDTHGFQNYDLGNGQTGTMVSEYYGNTSINDAGYRQLAQRGSWGMIFNNISSGGGSGSMQMTEYNGGTTAEINAILGTNYTFIAEVNNTYCFNNTIDGARITATYEWGPGTSPPSPHGIIENVNWWNYSASFNGTTGIGAGTSVPTMSATNGVGYWVCSPATPTVNPSIVQAGHFYKRVSGAWVDYYTPYTYPHPLIGTPSPTPTATATATASPTPTPTPTPTATVPGTSTGIQEVGNGSQRATTAVSGADMAVKAFPSNVTAGHEVMVWGAVYTASAITTPVPVTDTLATTYTTVMGTDLVDGGHFRTFIARGFPTASGPCAITVNPQGSSADLSFTQDVFSGTDPLVFFNGGNVQGTMVASTAGTATHDLPTTPYDNDTLVLAVMTHGNQSTALTASQVEAGKNENNSGSQAHIASFVILNAYARSHVSVMSMDYAAGGAQDHQWSLQTFTCGKANTEYGVGEAPATHQPNAKRFSSQMWP